MKTITIAIIALALSACGPELNKVVDSKRCTGSSGSLTLTYTYKIYESGAAAIQCSLVNGAITDENTAIYQTEGDARHYNYRCPMNDTTGMWRVLNRDGVIQGEHEGLANLPLACQNFVW